MRFPIAASYSPVQKIAHWLVALLCISQFPTAWAIQRTHIGHVFGIRPTPMDLFLHNVHAWSGWTILLLALLLIVIRAVRGAPALPHNTKPWQRWLAHAGHFCLYAGIVVLALTGTGTMYFSQRFAPIHILFVNLGIALVLLHAGAAIWHQFVRRDGILLRMLPNWLGKSPSTDATETNPSPR